MTCEERIAALEALVFQQGQTIATLTALLSLKIPVENVADVSDASGMRQRSLMRQRERQRRYMGNVKARARETTSRDSIQQDQQDSSVDHARMDIDATFFHKSNPVANPQVEKPVEIQPLPPRKPAAREMRIDAIGQGLLDLMEGHPMPLDGPGCQRLVNLAREAKPDVTLPEISQAVNVAYERKKRIQTSGGLFLHTVPPILKAMAKRDPFEAFADENFPLWRRLMSDRTRAELAWEDRNAA